jgi:dienelactone hydrolase
MEKHGEWMGVRAAVAILVAVGSALSWAALGTNAGRGTAGAEVVSPGGGSPDLPLLGTAVENRGSAGPLRLVRRELVASDAEEDLYGVVLADEEGREVVAYLRMPASRGVPAPAIVLAAGRHAGREAARLIPRPLDVVVLAVEYPAELPEEMRLHAAILDLPRMRRTALRMPSKLAGAARFVGGLEEVDSARIGLVGVSFGVPFAAWAGRDPIFGAVVLAFGGAGISEMLEVNLPIRGRPLRSAAARVAGWYFRELEPDAHVGAISPRPLLLVNGTLDTLVPRSSAIRLSASAASPVRHVWLPSGHVGALKADLIEEVAGLSTRFFEEVWSGGGSTVHGAEARGGSLSARLAPPGRGAPW